MTEEQEIGHHGEQFPPHISRTDDITPLAHALDGVDLNWMGPADTQADSTNEGWETISQFLRGALHQEQGNQTDETDLILPLTPMPPGLSILARFLQARFKPNDVPTIGETSSGDFLVILGLHDETSPTYVVGSHNPEATNDPVEVTEDFILGILQNSFPVNTRIITLAISQIKSCIRAISFHTATKEKNGRLVLSIAPENESHILDYLQIIRSYLEAFNPDADSDISDIITACTEADKQMIHEACQQ